MVHADVAGYIWLPSRWNPVSRLEITSKNVVAFDLLHKSSGKLFVERYGMDKFARFMQLYEGYVDGKPPAFLMAKELEPNDSKSNFFWGMLKA